MRRTVMLAVAVGAGALGAGFVAPLVAAAWPIHEICFNGQTTHFNDDQEAAFYAFLNDHEGAVIGTCQATTTSTHSSTTSSSPPATTTQPTTPPTTVSSSSTPSPTPAPSSPTPTTSGSTPTSENPSPPPVVKLAPVTTEKATVSALPAQHSPAPTTLPTSLPATGLSDTQGRLLVAVGFLLVGASLRWLTRRRVR